MRGQHSIACRQCNMCKRQQLLSADRQQVAAQAAALRAQNPSDHVHPQIDKAIL